MNGYLLTVLGAAAMALTPAPSQLRPPAHGVGIGDYTLHDFAAKWLMQQDDIAEIGHFAAANQALAPEPAGRMRIVQFGDSITAHWDLSAHDTAKRHFVNRGIGGQNSSQMVLRFESDVVALHPQIVVILAGTNDLRAYVGDPASVGTSALARISRNLTAMADMAKANHIGVVLSLIPPVGTDRERIARDQASIDQINDWIRTFARLRHLSVVDYPSALADDRGAMPDSYSQDGIHPNAAGYAVMWPKLEAAIAGLAVQ